jgi:cell division control protein 24
MIYNQLQPRSLLNVADVSGVVPGQYGKVCKDNVYHFILACRQELNLPEASDFSISELYKDDTHGFVKVCDIFEKCSSFA